MAIRKFCDCCDAEVAGDRSFEGSVVIRSSHSQIRVEVCAYPKQHDLCGACMHQALRLLLPAPTGISGESDADQ